MTKRKYTIDEQSSTNRCTVLHVLYNNITLYVFIFPICLCQRSRSLFLYMDRPGTCIILDKKYNIANSSCHFGSYGSIWTGPSPKKQYMDLRSFGSYNIFWVTDRSIYCHMTLSAMNYLLFNKKEYSPGLDSGLHIRTQSNKITIRPQANYNRRKIILL